jgi:hypothetical protein
MKAHSNYTTTVAAGAWGWRSALLFALAALFLGLMLIVRANSQLPRASLASGVAARQSTSLIVACRACRDEWVAAQAARPALAVPAQQLGAASATSASRTNGPIGSCRACRDEWVAAQAANVPIAASKSRAGRRPQSASLPLLARTKGPIGSCRMCRDEWIAAQTTQSIRAASSESTSGLDLDHPAQQLGISGPR